ncbi:MAG: hypothetical protein WCI11_10675 [Candidatus Methylumidiphilus sp.]
MIPDIYTGIIAGTLTAVLLTLLGWLYKDSILPKLLALFYRGPNISGKWSSFHSRSEGAEQIGECQFQQLATKVTGKAISNKSRSGIPRTRHWNISGSFSHGKLIIHFEDEELPYYIVGVGIFTLSGDGKALIGKVMYEDRESLKIEAKDFAFRR